MQVLLQLCSHSCLQSKVLEMHNWCPKYPVVFALPRVLCVHTEGWAISSTAIKLSLAHVPVLVPLSACPLSHRQPRVLVPGQGCAQPVFEGRNLKGK